ncbi:Glycosyltransferase involved in cell wall bisynthesis [Lachnospiraceae bacterium XBB2008]|nr:Glycosyltransferase involved in cell wall bisynthesis [Lachnospiraceae bacterium XBB2008]
MKILIVNKFLHPNGGSETYIFEIGKCLEKMGHEVQYFGMEHKGRIVGNRLDIYTGDMDFHAGEGNLSDGSGAGKTGGRLSAKLKKLTLPFKILYSRDAARKIKLVLEDFKPDVVHFNNINFQLTPSVIESVADFDIRHGGKTRMIYTAHDSQWVCPGHLLRVPSDGRRCFECEGGKYMNCARNRCIHNSRVRSLLGTMEAYLYKARKTYGLIDAIITPSRFMQDKLESDPVLRGKCITLHNFMPGVKTGNGQTSPEQTPGSVPDTNAHTDAVTVPGTNAETSPYVLYFGRFSEEKGIATLLKVCEALPEIDFVFAGSGPLETQVNALKNVRNVGFKSGDELKNLISEAAFSVFPSECHENCSFTVMESISYGTPIIASATGGTPELVDDGVNGYLFEPGDADGLSAKISELWFDHATLNKLEQGCAQTHFMTVDEYCKRLLEIYGKETPCHAENFTAQ